jgi:hypothetical protein
MRREDGILIDRKSYFLRLVPLSVECRGIGGQLTNRSKAALNQIIRTLDHEVNHPKLSIDQRLTYSSSIDHHQQ